MSTEVAAAPPAPKRTIKFARAKGVCFCGTPLKARREGARFCSRACKDAWNNGQKSQGAMVIDIAKRWRRYRRPGDFTLLSRLLDNLIREDIANGVHVYADPPLSASTIVINTARRRA